MGQYDVAVLRDCLNMLKASTITIPMAHVDNAATRLRQFERIVNGLEQQENETKEVEPNDSE